MNTLAKTLVPALTALGLAGAAVSPAFAETAPQAKVSVRYDDLDLTTAKGQKMLDLRVHKAVRDACRATDVTSGTRIISKEVMDCLARARTDAKQQVAAILKDEQRGG